ncbi:MAG: protein kinase [Planctomycetota bacterium]
MASSRQIELLAEIFSAVADAKGRERQVLLDDLCPNEEVKQLANELLAADSSTDLFVDQTPFTRPQFPGCGERIGPYKLLQSIGEGGMGIVYMAEQSEPVRRKVALKLIKPGVETKQVLARFDAERHALSLLDHPNIAKVLDAGVTESERPYFVMELMKGKSIAEYCRINRLSTQEKLELFIPVCHAVQHAHQKGIIHRDLKPSNVLVAEYDGRPVAKVIDFGVAKAIHQPLTELTMFTGYGQLVGTFEYMSPEQSRVNQLDVDTRADIYGLGVLLYEILTGTTPFSKERLRSVEWDEMLRIIREEDPPIPSTRLSETAQMNASTSETLTGEPSKISRIVRGEMDWIVMKALEKDRERRYATAAALADDIGSFLEGGPVAACPPTFAYRMTKFARRNRVALMTSSLVFITLVVGFIGTASQAIRARDAELEARQAESEAVRAAEHSDRINRYLRNDLLGLQGSTLFFDPKVKFDSDLKLVTLLERARGRLESGFADRPKERAVLQFMLAESYCSIGKYDVASDLLRPMVDQAVVVKRERYPGLLAGKSLLIQLEILQGNWRESIPLLEELLALKRDFYGNEHKETRKTLNNLAVSCRMIGDYHKAQQFFQIWYDASVRNSGPDSSETLNAKHYLAVAKGKLGENEVAESWLREVVEKTKETDADLDNLLSDLGEIYLSQGRFEEAQKPLTQACDLRKTQLGKTSPHTMTTNFYLATVYLSQEKLDTAQAIRSEFIAYFDDHPKLAHASVVEQMTLHAQLLLNRNEYVPAERLLNLANKILKVHQINSARIVGEVRLCLGSVLAGQGKLEEAESALLAGYTQLTSLDDASRDELAKAVRRLVNFHRAAGNDSKAVRWERIIGAND